jgi:membrane protease YdiL (CAAX protease family)
MILFATGLFCALTAALALIDPALYRLFKDLGWRYAFPLSYNATLILLIPLYLWYRRAARAKPLGKFQGEPLALALGLSLLLFLVPLSVRILHNLYFESLDEKIPLVFLVLLTLVLAEGYAPTSFGFGSQKLLRHLALGLFLYVTFGFVTTLGFTAIATGVNPFKDYDLAYFLLYLPTQIFAVALAEEALFRGYIQTKMSSLMGPAKAISLQALLFGLWHIVGWIAPLRLGSMAFHFASSFLFAIVLGAYFRYTRNLVAPVLLHGLTNAISGGAAVGLLSVVEGARVPYLIAGGVIALATTVLLAVLAKKVSVHFGVLAPGCDGG